MQNSTFTSYLIPFTSGNDFCFSTDFSDGNRQRFRFVNSYLRAGYLLNLEKVLCTSVKSVGDMIFRRKQRNNLD